MSRRRPPEAARAMGRVAVAVTCHAPYLHFLPECLAAWNAQTRPPDARYLALDACDLNLASGLNQAQFWREIHGVWKHPSGGRDAALAAAARDGADWIFYSDADNVFPIDLLEFLEPRMRGVSPDTGAILSLPAEHLNRDPRDGFGADTGSLWNVQALLHVGGWRTCRLEDWELANRLRAHGWKLDVSGRHLQLRQHAAQRRHEVSFPDKLWTAREIGIITLLRGDDALTERWLTHLQRLEIPERCGLTVVLDGENHSRFTDHLPRLTSRFQRVAILRAPERRDFGLAPFPAIHHRVGRLYGLALNATPEALILTWEDDVVPPADGLRKLSDALLTHRRTGAVAAVNPGKMRPDYAISSSSRQTWSAVKIADLSETAPREIELTGAGFTLWQRPALEQSPPLGVLSAEPRLGWDSWMCARMRERHWRIYLHGGVKCEHIAVGVQASA